MLIANERIVVQVTHSQKKHITSMAKRMGLNVSELMRRAAQNFTPNIDETALDGLLTQIQRSTEEAEKALETTLNFVKQSNERIHSLQVKDGHH